MRLLTAAEVTERLGFIPDHIPAVTARGDTNGDGYPDVVAILVQKLAIGRNSSVAVFQGGPDGFEEDPVWVIRDSEDSIAGVTVGEKRVIVTVCDGCDDMPVYYWSGVSYESGIRLPGSGVCIVPATVVYSAPNRAAPIVHTVGEGFGYADILELGARTENGTWWHRIRLTSSLGEPLDPEVEGFIDSSDFFLDIGC